MTENSVNSFERVPVRRLPNDPRLGNPATTISARSRSQTQTQSQTKSQLNPIFIGIAAIVAIFLLRNWFSQQLPAGCVSEAVAANALLQSIRQLLKYAADPKRYRPEIEANDLPSLGKLIYEYSTFPTPQCHSMPDGFLLELPFDILEAQVGFRRMYINTLTQIPGPGGDIATEEIMRQSDTFHLSQLSILKLYLKVLERRQGPPSNRRFQLTQTRKTAVGDAEYNLLEYASDYLLIESFNKLIPYFHLEELKEQPLAVGGATVGGAYQHITNKRVTQKVIQRMKRELNVLQLAENNHDEAFITWLKRESTREVQQFQPLVEPRLTAYDEKRRSDVFSAGKETLMDDTKDTDLGGWRRSAGDISSKLIADVENRGCPFTHVKASDLTEEAFSFLVRQKQPIIISDALPSDAAVLNLFRRDTIAKEWSKFDLATDFQHENTEIRRYIFEYRLRYPFHSLLREMDALYESQVKEALVYSSTATDSEPANSPPVFSNHTKHHWSSRARHSWPRDAYDSEVLERLGWRPLAEAEESSALPPLPQHALPKDFLQLPDAIRKAFWNKTSVQRFYVGAEGVGQPFHPRCALIDVLVYGKKR